MNLSRRHLIAAGATTLLGGAVAAPFVARADQAKFTYKYANNLPDTHPMNIRAREMAAAIKQETDGRVRSADFPDEPARLRYRHAEPDPLRRRRVLHAVRADPGDAGAGGLDQRHRLCVPGLRHRLEGDGRRSRRLCARRRSPRPISSSPWRRSGTTASARPRPRPSRSQTPDDFRGIKLRVPVSPLWTSMFKAFDASPASINFNEVYSALQTKIVDGQENPLAMISTAKLYEVQKYCSLTNHMWDGFWFLANQTPGSGCRPTCAPSSPSTSTPRREGARRRRQAERQSAAGSCRQGPRLQCARSGAVPRQASRGRLLHRVERQIRRRGLGHARKVGRQAGVKPWRSFRRRRLPVQARRGLAAGISGLIDAWLGAAVELIAAALVAAEIVILFSGVVARYVFDAPLVWSDELASMLFLWLAMLGAVIAFRRDEHMRMTAAVGSAVGVVAGFARYVCDRRRAGISAAHCVAGLRLCAGTGADHSRRRCNLPMPCARRRCPLVSC